ncbi:MAG: hypothetical protein FK732_00120 [Asgard group archaeon]|nr:hypothetical protein [Asgard group archaeon]
MIKKKIFQNRLVKIIESRFTNWEQKAAILVKVLAEEENGEEFFKDLILSHKKSKIRKGAASVLGYMDHSKLPKELVPSILEEKDWTVRFALSNTCAKHLRKEAVDDLVSAYNDRISSLDLKQKHNLMLIFAESLGYMEIKEAEPILSTMLKDVGKNRDKKSVELITQILYSLGDVGDKSTVELLLHYSANNIYTTEGIRNSAVHAIDKIAKRSRFTSKKALLEAINLE